MRAWVEGHSSVEVEGWELGAVAAGAVSAPGELLSARVEWVDGVKVGTAAAMLRAAGRFVLEGGGRRFDAEDWWFRCRLAAVVLEAGERACLCFDGLATVAEVWLDGVSILKSENMFLAHEVDVTSGAERERELVIRCVALDSVLRARRPRPRWRTPMIEQQQLRWLRTTLLGRTPGWSPPVAPVGPWRAVRLERRRGMELRELQLRAGWERGVGRLDVRVALASEAGAWGSATLLIEGPGVREEIAAAVGERSSGGQLVVVDARVAGVQAWWPHTHGEQPRYRVSLLGRPPGDEAGQRLELGTVGFRALSLEAEQGAFALSINGERVFWRGACWTPLDIVSLGGSAEAYRAALERVRDAGMNMLRVVGSMTYEQPVFYELCDELGIALWHDLMFANMDYPEEAGFVAGVQREVGQVLSGLQGRPCVVLLCGDSEGEQQAAMWGAPRAMWQRPLFTRTLRELCAALMPDVPYWPSSSSGAGAYPHQVNAGPTSYYGVGAYLRPLEDARRSELRFASECLAFANVPEPAMLDALGGDRTLHAHSPRWKERSPRDLGAGWDFDDVRDHYLELLFGFDPMRLRYTDHDRYVALARVTSGEVMTSAFAEWRRRRTTCGGALVWFLRDMWPGAGWGVIDSSGTPKAAYHYLRRVLQPVGVAFSDEGLSGLHVHVWNERPEPRAVQLRLRLFKHFEQRVAEACVPLELGARDNLERAVAASLDGFMDLTRAFRFGPPAVDVVHAELGDEAGARLGEAFFFPTGLPREQEGDLGLVAAAHSLPGGDYELTLCSRRFAQSVAIDVTPYHCDDMYFHLAPGIQRRVRLRAPASSPPAPLRGSVLALNARTAVPIQVAARG